MAPRTVAVTGASGFVGGAVCRALTDAGHDVIALGRRPVSGYEHRAYTLGALVPDGLLSGADVVVHCAYDLSLTDADAIAATNVAGTRALIGAASRAGVRPILVSSMSAYPGTDQIYGRAKLHSESDVLNAGGEAIRLGLVWGGAEGGMIGTLKRLAGLPAVPMFGRDPHQFTVHADDMASAFVALIEGPRLGRAVGLAHPAPVPFKRIVTGLGDGGRLRFIPVPWRPAYAALRVAERFRVPLPVRADSLLGLVRPAPQVPGVEIWPELGVSLRPFGPLDGA